MKILILTAPTGENKKFGNTIKSHFEDKYEDIHVECVNTFSRYRLTNNIIKKGAYFLGKNFSNLTNKIYEGLQNRNIHRNPNLISGFIRVARKSIRNLTQEHLPDVILCTHIIPAVALSELRKVNAENSQNVLCLFMLSNFDVTPYTECLSYLDHIITPSNTFNTELLKKGLDINKLIDIGIPIPTIFNEKLKQNESRISLGLDPNIKTVMIMCNKFGVSTIPKIVKNLCKTERDIQFIIVFGKASKTKYHFEKYTLPKLTKKIYCVGLSTKIEILMSASDLLIGDADGVTIANCINKNLPFIAIKKLPWQEKSNMMYLKDKDVIEYLSCYNLSYRKIERIFDNPDKIPTLKNNMKELRKADAMQDLENFILKDFNNY